MRRSTSWIGIALTLSILVLALACSPPLSPPQPSPPPPPPPPTPATELTACGSPQGQDVVLCLELDCSSGTCVITVDPDSTDIYPTNKSDGRPQFALWRAPAGSDHYWELTPKDGNGSCPDGEPYLDAPDAIDCQGSPITKTGPAKCDPGDHQQYEWGYDVTVFECVDGAKGDELDSLDPFLIINGGP